jgi:phosphomannomutase
MDGNFPNHHPDPTVETNLEHLRRKVKETGAELGIAFDGDADRIGAIDETGRVVWGDYLLLIYAREILARKPGCTFIGEVKCSQIMYDELRKLGANAIMYKTGHSLIKAKMKEIDSPLGGEMSGHIFFKERWFGFDDGTYAGCRLLEIVSRSPDANAVLNALPTSFSTPELNVKCAEGEPPGVVARAVALANFAAPARINTIDGLRVDWPDGFGLMRSSNTTPVLVLRFEGHTPEALQRIEGEMLALLRQVKPDATIEEAAH